MRDGLIEVAKEWAEISNTNPMHFSLEKQVWAG
jgi:hypothetical protein